MRATKEGKRIKRLSKNKTNFGIFLLFCFSIIGLTVGYSALNEEIKITGEAFVRPVKDVRITDVRLSETANEGLNSYNNFNVDSINVGASLPKTDSTVTYEVDISNIGDVSVIVKSITPDYGNNSNIEYVIEGIEVGKTIIGTNANKTDTDMGKPTTIKVTIKYKDGVTTIPTDPSASLKLTFKFVPVSILAESSGISDTRVFNNSNITKDNVKTITFKNTINVPADVTTDKVWDASLNKDNSVIAYYTTEEVNDVVWYNVVIGGYGKVQFPPTSSYLFSNYKNLEKIDFGDYIDTSNVTSMKGMFSNCYSRLTSLDLSNFDTVNVTDMSSMFSSCSNLKKLNISSFNTSKVTDMSSMFFYCSGLTSLDVTSFDTSRVTTMFQMFSGCSKLENLDVSMFDTKIVTNMRTMFSGCLRLTSLDVTSFDTSSITDMGQMFSGCSSLTSLDVSNFNTSNVTNMWNMFYNCKNLTHLNIKNFTFDKVTSYVNMLKDVPSSTIIYVKDQTAYDFINSKRNGGCTTDTCPICSNTGVTCP